MRGLAPPAILAWCLSCASPLAPEAVALSVQTFADGFAIPPSGLSVTVRFQTRNNGTRPVSVARCGDRLTAVIDRRERNEWVQVSGGACLAIYDMSPVRVNPGER